MPHSRAPLAALAVVVIATAALAQSQQPSLRPPMAASTPDTGGYLPYAPMQAPARISYTPPVQSVGAPMGMFGGGWGGGVMPNSMGYGFGLMGIADVTRAQGQYWNDIQSARMSQEQVRQEQLVTQRQRVQWEMDYEKIRPTAATMRDRERSAELDWARNDPPNTQIWSGGAFNILLRSILATSNPTGGPNVPLEQRMLAGINVRDRSSRGNLSAIKDEGKIEWPDSLMEKPFDDMRDIFSKQYVSAVTTIRTGTPPSRSAIKDLRASLKAMDDKVIGMSNDLSAMDFIEARREIRTLNDTVLAMSNPRSVKAAGSNWRSSIQNVSGLVNYLMKSGLEFGPAMSPNDYWAYNSLYFSLRSYERGLRGVSTK